MPRKRHSEEKSFGRRLPKPPEVRVLKLRPKASSEGVAGSSQGPSARSRPTARSVSFRPACSASASLAARQSQGPPQAEPLPSELPELEALTPEAEAARSLPAAETR